MLLPPREQGGRRKTAGIHQEGHQGQPGRGRGQSGQGQGQGQEGASRGVGIRRQEDDLLLLFVIGIVFLASLRPRLLAALLRQSSVSPHAHRPAEQVGAVPGHQEDAGGAVQPTGARRVHAALWSHGRSREVLPRATAARAAAAATPVPRVSGQWRLRQETAARVAVGGALAAAQAHGADLHVGSAVGAVGAQGQAAGNLIRSDKTGRATNKSNLGGGDVVFPKADFFLLRNNLIVTQKRKEVQILLEDLTLSHYTYVALLSDLLVEGFCCF